MSTSEGFRVSPVQVFNGGLLVGILLVGTGVALLSVPAALAVVGLLVIALTLYVARATGLLAGAGT